MESLIMYFIRAVCHILISLLRFCPKAQTLQINDLVTQANGRQENRKMYVGTHVDYLDDQINYLSDTQTESLNTETERVENQENSLNCLDVETDCIDDQNENSDT